MMMISRRSTLAECVDVSIFGQNHWEMCSTSNLLNAFIAKSLHFLTKNRNTGIRNWFSEVWGQEDFHCFENVLFLFSKNALNWSKVTIKICIMLQSIQINESKKVVFNNKNVSCPTNQHDFWRIMWHWMYQSYDCITAINYILKHLKKENSYFKL